MTEEEKKAIERLKDLISKARVIEDIEINKYVAFKDIETLIFLIKKQQKEIEELKEKNKVLENIFNDEFFDRQYKRDDIEKLFNIIHEQDEEIENSISKDKIRNLLKQVNASLYHFKDSDKNNIMQRIKDRLEELLEE